MSMNAGQEQRVIQAITGGAAPGSPPNVIATPPAGTTVSTPALAASKIIKTGPCTLISLTVSNTKAAVQVAMFFDSATLPADGAVPLAAYKVPAADGRSFDIPITGKPFTNGIVVCNSSTQATKTIGSPDCLFLAVVR